MSKYCPDGWKILKYSDEYYVFGGWSGSYLSGSSWKRNSGIVRVTEDDDYFYFYGYSGSVYECSKQYNRLDNYCQGVLQDIIERNNAEVIDCKDIYGIFDVTRQE